MSLNIGAFGEVMMRLETNNCMTLPQTDTLNYSFSGTGVNVLSALSHYGHHTRLITCLPNNTLGNAAQATIQKLGIHPEHIFRNGQYMGMYFLEKGFGSRPSRVTYNNRKASSFNSSDASIYDFEKIAKDINIVHFCGIALAMNDTIRNNMYTLAYKIKENGGTIVFDCNYRPSLWGEDGYQKAKIHYEKMLSLADMVMMNEKDAIHLLNYKTAEKNRLGQLKETIPQIAKDYKIKVIAGTQRTIHENLSHDLLGFIYQNEAFTFKQTSAFQVLDRIGAGDAFTSGIIHGFINHWADEKSLQFSLAASQLAHATAGDSPISTVSEINALINNHASDIQR